MTGQSQLTDILELADTSSRNLRGVDMTQWPVVADLTVP